MIWEKKQCREYGLYDRALGAAYLRGLWEAAKRKESRDETDITGFAGKRTVENAGIGLPSYDIEKVAEETKKNPVWVHFGAGNIFRIFIGGIADTLISSGEMKKGLPVWKRLISMW